MIFRKPVSGICMGILLGACGGGEPPPRVAPQPPTEINITALALSDDTPIPTVVGSPIRFYGGLCVGGSGTLTRTFTYLPDKPAISGNTHIYSTAGDKTVRIRCDDGNPSDAKFAQTTLPFTVGP